MHSSANKGYGPAVRRHPLSRKEIPRQPMEAETKSANGGRPTTITCKFCGKKHEWKKEVCPAWGKRCTKCNRLNHFAGLCNYRQRVNKVDQEYESEAQRDEDYLLALEEREPVLSMKETTYPSRIYALMTLKDVNVKFQLDCGATVNILPVNLYQDIFQDAQCKNLESRTPHW